jgi:hypothetical protein
LQLEAGRKVDQNMGEEFLAGHPAGALWLFDLGFFNAVFLAASAQAGSYFVCRLAASQLIFYCRNEAGALERFDLDAFLALAPRELFEIEVVFGPKQQVVARLVLAPVPEQVANERRRKTRAAARRQGRTPTQKTLQRCDWTLLLTNAAPEQLPTSTVLAVYGVRWQVELVFKLFKSDARLAASKAQEKYRAQCELYARLIALLLFNRLCGVVEQYLTEPLSPVKLWRRLRGSVEELLRIVGQSNASALDELLRTVARFALPGVRKKYPSTRQRLQQAAQSLQQVRLRDPLGYLRRASRSLAARKRACARCLERTAITFDWERMVCQRTGAAA